MKNNYSRHHWEAVYETKNPDEVSWTQGVPTTSLNFINSFGISKQAKIIDIGGGDSKLVDHLLAEGFENITVLDISAKALEKAQQRLGYKAQLVNWIVSDVTEFKPTTTYDVWHDRATFHFLTNTEEVERYLSVVNQAGVSYLAIGTFSNDGPLKCSGLDIKQYNQETLGAVFAHDFNKLDCLIEDHKTPFGTLQNFVYCSFYRKSINQKTQKND